MSYQGNVDGTQHPADAEVVFNVDAPPDVPAGTYNAQLIGMRPFSFETPEGETRNLIEWQFAAQVGDGDALELQGVTSLATGPKSKAFGWLGALLGAAAVVPNASIRARQLIGRDCIVTVGPDKKGWPKVLDVTAVPRPAKAKAAPEPAGSVTGPDRLPDDDLPF